MPWSRTLPLVLLAGALAACGDDGANDAADETTVATTTPASPVPVIDPGDGGDYHPALSPDVVVAAIDHPYLPLAAGNRWTYEGPSDGEIEHTEVVVTDETRTVMGMDATVVRDTVTVDGEVVEDTRDWFVQDVDGNVWYVGEQVDNYEGGVVVDHEGSWEAGVAGARPGIVMPAEPAVGVAYRQEFLRGEAEDLGEVIAVDGRVDGPTGHYDRVVTVREWNPLEPDVVEEKDYAPNVGLVRETTVAGGSGTADLLEFREGGAAG
jgi:hypothetical protein